MNSKRIQIGGLFRGKGILTDQDHTLQIVYNGIQKGGGKASYFLTAITLIQRGCDRMVVAFTTTHAVSAYHH